MWLVDGIVVAIVSSNCWFFISEKWDVFRGGTFHFYLYLLGYNSLNLGF